MDPLSVSLLTLNLMRLSFNFNFSLWRVYSARFNPQSDVRLHYSRSAAGRTHKKVHFHVVFLILNYNNTEHINGAFSVKTSKMSLQNPTVSPDKHIDIRRSCKTPDCSTFDTKVVLLYNSGRQIQACGPNPAPQQQYLSPLIKAEVCKFTSKFITTLYNSITK